MYYVYILFSKKDNKLYIGSTGNLKQRICQHKRGLVDATKYRLPVKMIYCEIFISKKDSLREERFLKSGKGRERLKELLKNIKSGSVAEWLKAPVSKTGSRFCGSEVQILPLPPQWRF